MERPVAVANYFIQRSQDEGKPLTPMQVMKLTYIAHGWQLGITGNQLLTESVEAWKYGPVIQSIYHAFKKYGNNPITELAIDFKMSSGITVPKITDSETTQLLSKIWDLYSGFSGVELSTMTHMKGTPWYKTWYENGGKDGQNVAIPNDTIKEHYKQKIASGTNDSAH